MDDDAQNFKQWFQARQKTIERQRWLNNYVLIMKNDQLTRYLNAEAEKLRDLNSELREK